MTDTLKELSNAMADTVEQAAQGIVRVEARRRLPATGIAWAENIIVTANHIIERDDNIQIGLSNGDVVDATLIGRDPSTDIAVLRAETGIAALPHNGDGLRIGNLVLAIGRPGTTGVQASLGVVSAIGANEPENDEKDKNDRRAEKMQRRAERMARRYGGAYSFAFSTSGSGIKMEGAVQTDVVMYPGFSGGPLVDAGGVVRGMNTSALARGASIAVPVATIERVTTTLMEHGRMRQGFLGVGAQPVRLQGPTAEQVGQETGLLAVSIEAGSPADSGGLLVGDIMIALDNQPVRHLDELLALLSGDRVGREVPVLVVRGGQTQELAITIGERV